MTHLLVQQLRFTRSEWQRGFEGVTVEDAQRRCEPMNSLSWMMGHLAWHEQLYWLDRAQGIVLVPDVIKCGYGSEPCNPPFEEMVTAYQTITAAADAYLDTLMPDLMQTHFMVNGQPMRENIGTLLIRMTYHYWYHLGESQSVRQMFGHQNLPAYVGGDLFKVSYHPE